MADGWRHWLTRWKEAGFLNEETAARITAHELERERFLSDSGSRRMRWPVIAALAFGGVALGAGVLLFVASHWDQAPPAIRLLLVLAMLLVFHGLGFLVHGRSHGFTVTFHALGSIALGAAVFLTGQIFHMEADWPRAFLVWGLGGLAGWLLLHHWPQFAVLALAFPVWIASEYTEFATRLGMTVPRAMEVIGCGSALWSLVYFSAGSSALKPTAKLVLMWIGGITLIPSVLFIAVNWRGSSAAQTHWGLWTLGWAIALAVAAGLMYWLHRERAWVTAAFAVWVMVLQAAVLNRAEIPVYLLCAAGAGALVFYGWWESRVERINLGMAGFVLTVLFFYFARVMDMFGRSLSLIALGVLFLAGGWQIERFRRNLVRSLEDRSS